MGQPIGITDLEYSAADLRRLASREKRGEVVRRLLALAMILEGHVAAFEHFGGVPQSILYDNTKLAVAKIVKGGKRLRSRMFAELQSFVGRRLKTIPSLGPGLRPSDISTYASSHTSSQPA